MAEQIALKASVGRELGTSSSRRLRREGMIPAVVYGLGIDPTPIALDYAEARIALTGEAGTNALLNLDIGGEQQLCLVKDLQHHLVRDEVTHIDFVRVDPNADIETEVPIVLTGDARAVTQVSGMVDQALFSVLIATKPTSIPNEIEVDVSEMEVGDSIRVADLVLPEGVRPASDPDAAVATALVTRSTLESMREEEAAELLEGEEGAEAADADADGDADAESSED